MEGSITWSEMREASVDEIDWLVRKAEEINDQRSEEMRKMKSRSSVRGKRR
jgi:hypothetical protein